MVKKNILLPIVLSFFETVHVQLNSWFWLALVGPVWKRVYFKRKSQQ